MKRFVALFFTVVMALSLCMACVSAETVAVEPLTVTMMYRENAGYPYKADWLIWEAIREKTGITVEPIIVPSSDFAQKRNLYLTTGEAPDFIPKTGYSEIKELQGSGVLLPVSDYLDLMPNLSRIIQEWELTELDNICHIDGKFYLMPGIKQYKAMWIGLVIRADILAKIPGAQIDTYDHLYETLKAIKEMYPDSYPLTAAGDNWLSVVGAAFGINVDKNIPITYQAADDKFVVTAASQEYKTFLDYLNKLLEEGLLDPESFTQEEQRITEKLVTDRAFATFASNSVVYEPNQIGVKTNFEFNLALELPPIGTSNTVPAVNRLGQGVVLPASVKDKPYFERLISFLDWYYYSDEGIVLGNWGVEGVTYATVDGVRELVDGISYEFKNPGGEKDLQKDFGMVNGSLIIAGPDWEISDWASAEDVAYVERVQQERVFLDVEPNVLFTDDEMEEVAILKTGLMDYVERMKLEFITGKADIETGWTAFVENCGNSGGVRLLEMYNQAWSR
ncbi:MAG: extracellular solute-binding protein [Eubacteriales bacterium]|nr:extracellular solute-binding protein [Eubacteriales bacterium]